MAKHPSPAASATGHPMQIVIRRTGLTPDVLRVWERRYGVVKPKRTAGNRRVYSDADLDRLLLLAAATRSGRGIGQVARLPLESLRALVRGDQESAVAARGAGALPPASTADAASWVQVALLAVTALEAVALEDTLTRSALALGPGAFLRQVASPLLHDVGERWREGSLRIAHEHLSTAVVRSALDALRRLPADAAAAPVLVAAMPAGQQHEFGALMAAIEAEAAGYRVLCLGPSLPAEEIAVAALAVGARVVALSLIYPPDDARLADELIRLRRHLGPGPVFVAGGGAAASYSDGLRGIDARVVRDLDEFRQVIDGLRQSSHSRK